MPNCPQCHQRVTDEAVNCPYCRSALKAFGHPGIPVHRATGQEPLCSTCSYHEDDSCTLPKRPQARDCSLYHDRIAAAQAAADRAKIDRDWRRNLRLWYQRHQGLVIIGSLIVISLLLVIIKRQK